MTWQTIRAAIRIEWPAAIPFAPVFALAIYLTCRL